jgi:hypothetical protein
MALDPGYVWGRQWYGAYLGAVGRLDESLDASRHAQQLDPLSVTANTHVGAHLFFNGRYEEAIQQYRKALELDPNFFMARWGLSRAYLQLGRHAEAMRELQYPGTDYLGFFRPALLGYAHAVAGQEAEARHVLAELRERREQGEYVAPTEFAAIHVGLGEESEALDWLERHEADRGARIFLKVDPIFEPLQKGVSTRCCVGCGWSELLGAAPAPRGLVKRAPGVWSGGRRCSAGSAPALTPDRSNTALVSSTPRMSVFPRHLRSRTTSPVESQSGDRGLLVASQSAIAAAVAWVLLTCSQWLPGTNTCSTRGSEAMFDAWNRLLSSAITSKTGTSRAFACSTTLPA